MGRQGDRGRFRSRRAAVIQANPSKSRRSGHALAGGWRGALDRPRTGEKRPMSRAFVFPGQGSQAVGMGADLAGAFGTARDVFHEVDEALKQNLSKLMREGPESDLVLTENAQPALMAVSVAVPRILEKDGGKPVASLATHVAGHSLGEYS